MWMVKVMSPYEILVRLAVPRPSGSEASERTAHMIADYLGELTTRLRVQEFFLRPFMQPVAGLFFLLASVLCLVLASKRRYRAALIIALLIPAIYIVEFELNVPVVTWLGGRTGVNVIADFVPADGLPERHITFSAHYDSKTDVFDHEQRKPIHNFAPIAMVCLIASCALGIASCRTKWALGAHKICLAIGCLGVGGLAMLALAFGGGLFMPPERQSAGARDDGAAVAVLLSMAEEVSAGHLELEQTAVRFVFFGGEEVNMQGSAAYARDMPAWDDGFDRGIIINCEFIGGEAPSCYWESSGTFLSKFQASDEAIQLYQDALTSLGFAPPVSAGSIFDDSGRLLSKELRAVTVGHADPKAPDTYHNVSDSIDRVVSEKLEQMKVVFLQMLSMLERDAAMTPLVRIPMKSSTHSGGKRPLVPAQIVRPFRLKSSTCSGSKNPVVSASPVDQVGAKRRAA
jgi:hypothetical protein